MPLLGVINDLVFQPFEKGGMLLCGLRRAENTLVSSIEKGHHIYPPLKREANPYPPFIKGGPGGI